MNSMRVPVKQQKYISGRIEAMFKAKSGSEIVQIMKEAVAFLKHDGFFTAVPDFYENISAETTTEIRRWHEELKDDNRDTEFEEGNLKELYGLFSAATDQLEALHS